MDRNDGRASDQFRPVAFEFGIAPYAGGSVLVTMGNTRVICGVKIEENMPRWMKEQGVTGGWLGLGCRSVEFHFIVHLLNERPLFFYFPFKRINFFLLFLTL